MGHLDVVRAWKDSEYAASLTAAERALLPPNPVGDLTDSELEAVLGGSMAGSVTCPTSIHNGCPSEHGGCCCPYEPSCCQCGG